VPRSLAGRINVGGHHAGELPLERDRARNQVLLIKWLRTILQTKFLLLLVCYHLQH
jgi:hypothetical protein